MTKCHVISLLNELTWKIQIDNISNDLHSNEKVKTWLFMLWIHS